MQVFQNLRMDLARCGCTPIIGAVQGEANTRTLVVSLYDNGVAWEIPEAAVVDVAFKKPDGTQGIYSRLPDGSPATTFSGNVLTATLAPQALTCAGKVAAAFVFHKDGEKTLATFPFMITVTASPAAGAERSEDYYNPTISDIEAEVKAIQVDVEYFADGVRNAEASATAAQASAETAVAEAADAKTAAEEAAEKAAAAQASAEAAGAAAETAGAKATEAGANAAVAQASAEAAGAEAAEAKAAAQSAAPASHIVASATKNGTLTNGLSVDTKDPNGDRNRPQIVESGVTSSIPNRCQRGLRIVEWQSTTSISIRIMGITNSGRPAVWLNHYNGENWHGWYQLDTVLENTSHLGCYCRYAEDGSLEWLNPPMALGTEYRTTERCEGEVVYVKRISYTTDSAIGNASSTTDVSIPHNIANIGKRVRVFGRYNDAYFLPMVVSGGGSVSVSYLGNGTVGLRMHNTTIEGTFYFDLYYTKTT